MEIIWVFGDNARCIRETAAEFNLRHPWHAPITHGKSDTFNAVFNETDTLIKVFENGQPRRIHRHLHHNAILTTK